MDWRFSFVGSLAAAFTLALAGVAQADTPAPRQLVYSFSYGSQQSTVARDSNSMDVGSSNSPGGGSYATSGNSHYTGNLGETGTVTVDVVREQPDKGLVVSISEQGRNTRSAPPATCVVYGNTSVICDPQKTVNPEEYTLLRFLGSNFIDPNQLDAKQHWAVHQNGGGVDVTGDYVIQHNSNGLMTVGETRTVKQASSRSTTTDVQTTIGYDSGRLLPTAVNEYVTQRQDNGVVGTTTTLYQTTFQLVSASATAKI